jgi:hypothetical protein
MIEISLIQIPADEWTSTVGKCIARNRFDKEAMGVTIEEFARGFLKENLEKFENGIGSAELTELINSSGFFGRKDLACVNYYLSKVGYQVKIFNVTDDEVDLFLAEFLRHDLSDVLVTGAVETVFADAVFLVPLYRDWVHVLDFGDGLMESSIEDCDLGSFRQSLLHRLNTGDVTGVMQRP